MKWLLALCFLATLRAQSLEQHSVVYPADVRVADWFLVDLDGDGVRELLLVDAAQRRLVSLKAPWKAPVRRDIVLPADAVAFTFAEVAAPAGEDLLVLSAQGVRLLAGGQETLQPWLDLPLLLPPAPTAPLRCQEWARDHDGDGFEDLLLPGVDHEWLVSCDAEGKAARRRIVGPAPTIAVTRGAAGALMERAERRRAGLLHRTQAPPLALVLGAHGVESVALDGVTELLFPLPGPATTLSMLERVECSTEQLEPGADDALLVARTRAEEGRIPEPRTELLLYRCGKREPAGALLLSGLLSQGPDLADVNGDGRMDLMLSVVASGVRGELQRAVGKCPVTWHVYLHRGGDFPWPRSPDFSLTDTVDGASFDTWGLRHRVFSAGDLNGDGLHELARVERTADGLRFTLYLGKPGKDGPFAEDPWLTTNIAGEVIGYSAINLGRQRGVMVRHSTGCTLLTLR